jgi:hypothetical protein
MVGDSTWSPIVSVSLRAGSSKTGTGARPSTLVPVVVSPITCQRNAASVKVTVAPAPSVNVPVRVPVRV